MMKKLLFTLICFATFTVAAQDTIPLIDAIDTTLAVVHEAAHEAPRGGTFQDWIVWIGVVLSLGLGLWNFFKGKKIKT